MTQEIRFTSYGIPYLVEFANVKIRSWAARMSRVKRHHRTRKNSIAPTPPPPPPPPAKTPNGGIYIHFPSGIDSCEKLSPQHLARLKSTIVEAVQSAGMDAPPKPATRDHRAVSTTRGALFRGTYGQVTTALQAAGLNTTPCRESGFYEGESATTLAWLCAHEVLLATRLGALFVVGHNAGNVELSKLTLWG